MSDEQRQDDEQGEGEVDPVTPADGEDDEATTDDQ